MSTGNMRKRVGLSDWSHPSLFDVATSEWFDPKNDGLGQETL